MLTNVSPFYGPPRAMQTSREKPFVVNGDVSIRPPERNHLLVGRLPAVLTFVGHALEEPCAKRRRRLAPIRRPLSMSSIDKEPTRSAFPCANFLSSIRPFGSPQSLQNKPKSKSFTSALMDQRSGRRPPSSPWKNGLKGPSGLR